MNDQPIIFEFPLREQIRSFLRLEQLFNQFERNRLAVHSDNHFHSLKTLFEILEILERGDTRSELIKDLSKLASQFETLRNLPQVDSAKLDSFLAQIKQLYHWALNYEGRFGDKIRKNPFIESVRHRTSIPGGTCAFDTPELFLFLNAPHIQRQTQLKNWIDEIKAVKTSIDVILRMSRENGQWQQKNALLGSFMLETTDTNYQLLRVKLSATNNLYPEFSCGKHRSNIQFMRYTEDFKKIPLQKSVSFELACCQ